MIKLLIDETDKNRSAKAYIFYGFNTASSIVGFLLAGLSAAVAWSVREQLPARRNVSGSQVIISRTFLAYFVVTGCVCLNMFSFWELVEIVARDRCHSFLN